MDSQKCQGGIEDVRGAQACEAGAVPNIVHPLRFFFRSGIPSVQRLHIFTQFRTTSIHYVYMCSDVFFVLCYFILGVHFCILFG